MADTLACLGLQVLQRDWLSANQTVFPAADGSPATVVDTGHARHARHTQALLHHALRGTAVQRILNTHLHSDHCGGNAALQQQACDGRAVQTWVPANSVGAVARWEEERLSYQATGQICPPFHVHGALVPDQSIRLGVADWHIVAAPGHDPDAVMLFEPQSRTLIAGDALWEDRLAIIFPELEQQPGFAATRATLDRIEQLAPRRVIPGHGGVFEDVARALATSRQRLAGFEARPERHLRHAARALAMFHMMEHTRRERHHLVTWLQQTPVFRAIAAQHPHPGGSQRWATELLAGLLDDGLLQERENWLCLPEHPPD